MNIARIKKQMTGGFRPFVLRTSDGREFKVPHPEFILLSEHGGIAVVDDEGDINLLDALHIVSLREIRSKKSAAKANGDSGAH